jgi:hypothetical protein
MISQSFGGGLIVEAAQPGVIILCDNIFQEAVALGMVEELVLALISDGGGAAGDGFGEAATEALDHAVCLWAEGSVRRSTVFTQRFAKLDRQFIPYLSTVF